MYESDEWYIQDQFYKKDKSAPQNTKLGNSMKLDQSIGWDLDSSASDNESFDIEMDGSHLD